VGAVVPRPPRYVVLDGPALCDKSGEILSVGRKLSYYCYAGVGLNVKCMSVLGLWPKTRSNVNYTASWHRPNVSEVRTNKIKSVNIWATAGEEVKSSGHSLARSINARDAVVLNVWTTPELACAVFVR